MRAFSCAIRYAATLIAGVAKTILLAALLAAVPYGLVTQVGWPLPRRLPTTVAELDQLLTPSLSDAAVVKLLAVLMWTLWLAFVACLVVELIVAARGIPRPRLGPIGPLQSLAARLVSGIGAGLLVALPALTVAGHATPAAAAATAPDRLTPDPTGHTSSIAAGIATAGAPAADRRPSPAHVEPAATASQARTAVYQVARGDWLGGIAQRYLGQFDRYPQLRTLMPARSGPHGPDHIEPGWHIVLPAGAHDRCNRDHATGHLIITANPPGTPHATAPDGSDTPPTARPRPPMPGGSHPAITTPTISPRVAASTPAAPTTAASPAAAPPSGSGTASRSAAQTPAPAPPSRAHSADPDTRRSTPGPATPPAAPTASASAPGPATSAPSTGSPTPPTSDSASSSLSPAPSGTTTTPVDPDGMVTQPSTASSPSTGASAAVVVQTATPPHTAPVTAVNWAHRAPPATAITLSLSTMDERGPVLVAATTSARAPATQMPVYEVRHDDWLGIIAERYLGDFDRYPDIQRLNPDLIDDPDHIEPGWRLILPADAYDHGARVHATGLLVVTPPATTNPTNPADPTQPGPGGAQPSPNGGGASSPAPSATPSPSVRPSSPSSSPAPSTTASSTEAAGGPAASANAGNSDPAPHSDPPAQQQPGHRHGVSLPGGWISLPFAAALVAAAAMVWLRRRHRYVPTPLDPDASDDEDLRPLPPVVNRVRRAVREQAPELLQPTPPATPTVADFHAADAAHRPDLPPVGPGGVDLAGLGDRIPTGGLGLVGLGAEAAARGLLVATLSAGSPADPDAKGQVIIPADALTTLLGADAVQVGDIPRLQVTANLSEALARAEELVIERRRLLQDHDADDLAELRTAHPYHPPMPPVLMVADTPPAELRARLTTALHLGEALQISAVLLGDWPCGDTLTVHADGRTNNTNTPGGRRLGVLDVPTTLHLLQVLKEAHTGQPPTTTVDTLPGADLTTPAPAIQPPDDATTAPASDATEPAPVDSSSAPAITAAAPTTGPATDAASAADTAVADATEEVDVADEAEPAEQPDNVAATAATGAKPGRSRAVRVDLLGEPAILDRDGSPVDGLRHHARELLVYLAVHRSGADLSQIMEAFWPTATVRRAGERLSTEVGNLRGRIKHAAGVTKDDKGFQPVVNTGSRYHLNPDAVDIDVWRLIDLLRRVGTITDSTAKATLLRQAVDAYTGTLADGHDYDWIDQPREQLRRYGIRARLDLAALLGDTEPATAADLVHAAAQLDPINEDLARQAMRAMARVGDAAAVRAVLQQLRAALDDIDEEPSAETIAVAAQLQRDITSTGAGSSASTGTASDETRTAAGNDPH
jgi:DNA-binding SARP family transcriptional activator